ncbi:MAG: hypothetical protein K0R24_560 [Gammaproteobacteria bacterium]|jgi:hypothetical protein|nr:hypothetical protein [Gammaproteobacteria bacterium]MCE3237579.1 hypothetical protein [Gammaproteobacteria bacterium]
MYWDVTSVIPEHYLTIRVKFSDGLQGTVNFEPSHLTGVFASLKNEQYFNKVFVDHGVVTWPGELDLAPDAMYAEIKKNGCWILR